MRQRTEPRVSSAAHGASGSAPAAAWPTPPPTDTTTGRVWDGFATARVMVALSVLLLQALLQALGQGPGSVFLGVCAVYLAQTLFVRIVRRPHADEPPLTRLWWQTIGVDLAAFSAMQLLQPGGMNYTPLLALPVLMASVLGTRMSALGTAAGVTLLLLLESLRIGWLVPGGTPSQLLQAGFTGIGYFLVAFLVHPLAARLAREEALVQSSQRAAAVQAQVNELVIESLSDGVLVVDAQGKVQAANPASLTLLDAEGVASGKTFWLRERSGWEPLAELARQTFIEGAVRIPDLTLQHEGLGPRRLEVQTRLTPLRETVAGPARSRATESLCVMFLQDLRESEARLRTEKMAAMGRMSAAVAHEIRNPLAAIMQANQLLDEELQDPGQKQLAALVRQNAQRLARIAEEVLDVSRAQRRFDLDGEAVVNLDETIGTICLDWHVHAGRNCGLQLILGATRATVDFDGEHLRRVMVNLLENALRYISAEDDALQVRTGISPDGQSWVEVWSDGAPLEPAVERRLFEPFFSSESRSSGLGLYICRELCERHGALLVYRRVPRPTGRGMLAGNAFTAAFRRRDEPETAAV